MGCWGQWVGADTCAVSGRGVSGSEGYIRFWAVVCQETRELWHSTAQNWVVGVGSPVFQALRDVLQSLMSENREKPALNSAKHKERPGWGQRPLQPRGAWGSSPRGASGFGPWRVGLRGAHPVLGRGVSGNVRIVARHSPKRGLAMPGALKATAARSRGSGRAAARWRNPSHPHNPGSNPRSHNPAGRVQPKAHAPAGAGGSAWRRYSTR